MGSHDTEVRIGQLCEAAAVPFKPVWKGTYTRGLQPLRPAQKGQRDSARYALCQVVAVRVARLLDKRFGVEPADMRDLVSRLWHMTPAELTAEFRLGRTCCVIVGRAASDELFAPAAVTDFDAELRRRGFRARVVAVSVEREFERVVEALLPPSEVNRHGR